MFEKKVDKIKIKVRAKINLSLNVFPNDYVAYHRIDSVVTSVDVYDVMTFEKRGDSLMKVECKGINIEEADNTAFKTAVEVRDNFGLEGVNIVIEKGIPSMAGMGGSAADGAGVIYAFSRMFDVSLERLRLHSSHIGSDIPYMTLGGLAQMSGFGERFTLYDCMYSYGVILIPCEPGNSTADVYRAFDRHNVPLNHVNNTKLIKALSNHDIEEAARYMGNSLLPPALSINPNLDYLYKYLKPLLPNLNMSGSGSMLYTICQRGSEDKYLELLSSHGIEATSTFTTDKGIEIVK